MPTPPVTKESPSTACAIRTAPRRESSNGNGGKEAGRAYGEGQVRNTTSCRRGRLDRGESKGGFNGGGGGGEQRGLIDKITRRVGNASPYLGVRGPQPLEHIDKTGTLINGLQSASLKEGLTAVL